MGSVRQMQKPMVFASFFIVCEFKLPLRMNRLERIREATSWCGPVDLFCMLCHPEPEGGAVFEVVSIVLVDKLDSVFNRSPSSRNLCHRFKELERDPVIAEIQQKETTTRVDVGMQEVARPVGSHHKSYADEGSFNAATRDAKERGG